MKNVKTVALIGSLDTKADEVGYLKKELEKQGFKTVVIDVGVLGVPLICPDIEREEVAAAGGSSLSELVENAEKGVEKENAVNVMIRGIVRITQDLHESGKIHAVVAVGGAIGTAIGTAAMRVLPYGVPKMMVSIVLSSRLKHYVDAKDIVFMNYPTDILGLNFLTRKVLSNASAAVAGMLAIEEFPETPKRLIALTSLGVTTPAVIRAKEMIESMGYETIVYTIDTEGMDELLENKSIHGIVDLTPYELVSLYITKTSSHLDRFSFAYETGIPIVIAPGGLDFIILSGSINDVPENYRNRKLYKHSPYVTLVRVSKEEAILLGQKIAQRANTAKGPIAIVIPLRGFSSVDKEGQSFYDPAVDKHFAKSVKKNVMSNVKVIEIDAHINDEMFATEIIKIFSQMTHN